LQAARLDLWIQTCQRQLLCRKEMIVLEMNRFLLRLPLEGPQSPLHQSPLGAVAAVANDLQDK
jgi:hypothetical protein